MTTAILAGLLAGWAAFFAVPAGGLAGAETADFSADAISIAASAVTVYEYEDVYVAIYEAMHVLAAEGRGAAEVPADGALRQSLLSLEEQIGAWNRQQGELQRDIAALRRKNRSAAQTLTREQRMRIRPEAQAAMRDIKAARQEFEKIRKQTQNAVSRFRHHRRQLDWEAVRADLALIARYGEQATEQLKRELDGERRLGELLQRALTHGGA